MINFDISSPANVKSVLDELRKDPGARIIAGGTNLVDHMKRGIAAPEKLLDISRLPLREIEDKGKFIRIGALALNSEVSSNRIVLDKIPLLSQALEAGASPQLRNMATVGGNLLQRTRCTYFYDLAMPCNKRKPGSGCGAMNGYNRMHAIFGASEQCVAVHPSDMCVGLAALDASVVVAGSKGERRIPFSDFHRLPGTTPERDTNLLRDELIVAVEVPVPAHGGAHYLKIRDRASYAFALVSVAVSIEGKNEMDRVRIALGGVAHKPWRALTAEKMLQSAKPSDQLFRDAAEAAVQGAKGLQHNQFKIKLAAQTIYQALKNATT